MESITVGNVRVDPFVFESLTELRIEKKINEHATLYVKGIVKDGWKNMPVTNATEYTNIKCEDFANVYFSGVLQSVVVTCEDDVYSLEARAISHTIKLDTKKYKRSFQNDGRTYKDIISAIIYDGGGTVNYHADPEPIDCILVQYDETDWQFAKRLASHTQDVLLSRSLKDNPEFNFGVEDGVCVGEILATRYSVAKDFDLLRSRANDNQPLSEDSITMYKVKTEDFVYGLYDAGDKVLLNGNVLYVREAEYYLKNNIMISSYTLASKEAITAPKIFNSDVTGLALKGIVQVAENDDVKLDLDLDYGGGASQLFKYATDYSPESHTGWYVMPEIGDTVFLVFPTENEKDAHASSSMRQSATGKTGDPLTKFLRTPFGKEVKLNDKEVLITGKDDETYIKINEDSGIDIYTLKPVNVFSNETLNITSTDDMTIDTKANLTIKASDSIHIQCGDGAENTIHITPGEGINVNTTTDLVTASTGNTVVDSVGKTAVHSTDDMQFVTDANMLSIASASMHTECGNGGENIVHITPGAGINVSTTTDLVTSSKGNTSIDSIGKTEIHSTDEMALVTNSDMNISSDLNLMESGKTSITLSNVVHSINMDLAKGISIVSLTNLNMAATLMASLVGTLGLNLASVVSINSAALNVSQKGLAAVQISGGTGSVQLTPAGVDIKGPLVMEN